MNEFELIQHFFHNKALPHTQVIQGIGDDGAVLRVPSTQDLVVSTDTLVEAVHFFSHTSPADIAYKAVMVNISDCAAMGATPFAITLALTLPHQDETWLTQFSQGLHEALKCYGLALVGGDTTRGPLTVTITIHAFVPKGRAVYRSKARVSDLIYVTGFLGLAAYALHAAHLDKTHHQALYRPKPRVDWIPLLRRYATAAIDISDGLLADLSHIANASHLGADMVQAQVPLHPLVLDKDLRHALSGGDDYELCLTIPAHVKSAFLKAVEKAGLQAFEIGQMIGKPGLWEQEERLEPQGYQHF